MRYLLLSIIACAMLASCNQKRKSTLTEKDYTAFASRFDSLMNAGNGSVFVESLDLNGLTDSVMSGQDISIFKKASYKKEVSKGFREGLAGIGTQISSYITQGGSYRLLRIYSKNNRPHALFRLNTTEGINYHDLALTDVDGKVMIGDIYIYLSGENLSATFSRLMAMGTASEASTQSDNEAMILVQKLQSAKELLNGGRYKAALNELDDLPEKFRNDKTCQLMRIQAAMKLDDDTYTNAISTYERLFPDDPSLNLILIDGYILRGNYGEAMSCVDRLDKEVHDPYLDVMRGNLFYRMNDLEASEKSFRKAIKDMKDIDITPYVNVAQLCIMQDKSQEALEVIKELSRKFKLKPSDALNKATYNEYFKQREDVQAWLASEEKN